MIGTRLCPPASTRPSCGATRLRILSASSSVFGAWRMNGAGFMQDPTFGLNICAQTLNRAEGLSNRGAAAAP